ncbi:MAG: hypothetical protein GC192_05850 [Bacteroidetes bacterium]|nr:hypothetical protein [Bacteroidota bacterium]
MLQFSQPGAIVSLINDRKKPIFFLGAGASKQSGIKLASEIVEEAAKWKYCIQQGMDMNDPRLTMSDWKKWLQTFPWYTEDYSTIYPRIVEEFLHPVQAKKDFFLKIINPRIPSSKGYEKLSELLHLGLLDTVLTTNFDNCLYHAGVQIRKTELQSIKTPSDYSQFSYTPIYPQVVYLHGSVEHYTDQNLINEVQNLNSEIVSMLKPLLKDRPLVVIGYRGAEPSIMNDLLLNQLQFTNNFRQGVYWCILKKESEKFSNIEESFTPLLKDFASKLGNNFQLVTIDGFDELLEKELWGKLAATQIDVKNLNVNLSLITDIQRDAVSSLRKNTLGPVEIAFIRERIKNYSERLRVKVYNDDEWLHEQMIRLRIAESIGESVELTKSGILLFSSRTQEYVPASFVVLKFIGNPDWLKKITSFLTEKEIDTMVDYSMGYITREIKGNIWNQLNEVTDALALINRPYRLKGETSENVYPYPTLALKEIIVNSLVHRDYLIDEFVRIDVYEDCIIFTSPGGLVEEVKRQLSTESLEVEIKKGNKGIKGYRNPVIADIFYGAGAMDKEGSGLSDVVKQVTNNSSTVSFGVTTDEKYFEVKIYKRIEEFDEDTKTATPIKINESSKFACNLLEVLNLPAKVFHASTVARIPKDISKILGETWNPPCLLARERLWSFYDLTEYQNPLRKCVDVGTVEELSLEEFISQSGNTIEFVRMLNQCIIEHMFSIGLRVDVKKKRAYFTKTFEETAKEITYQARLKKATRTVARPKINSNSGKISYWEHKSIWFKFEQLGNKWYLIINPAYVFTTDGIKNLLKSERVNILSTRKASRDYNMAVHNDLTFWSNYLSNGNENAFLLRMNNKEINDGTKIGPIPPSIVVSSRMPTVVVNDISVSEDYVEPAELIDLDQVEKELEKLAIEENLENKK